MSDRLFYGKNPPFSLVETLNFSSSAPYIIRQKNLENDDVAIMHYSDSLELSVYCNVEGQATIMQKTFSFSGNSLLLINPNVIHSVSLKKGNGHVFVLHVSFSYLKQYMDIENILKTGNLQLFSFSQNPKTFEKVKYYITQMIENDSNIILRNANLLMLFNELTYVNEPKEGEILNKEKQTNKLLLKLIEWTEHNYNNRLLSVEDAADTVGFSKTYFCTWFKNITGLTYNKYLTDVRIAKACSIILDNCSATITGYECGFSDLSYFVKVFKAKTGLTPNGYLRLISKNQQNQNSRT